MKNLLIPYLVFPLISIMFWNVENYFDYFDDGFSASDREFSSRGAKHWTKARFNTKTYGMAKTVLWAGAPEVLGLAEVENAFVLNRLCNNDILRKLDYRYVHFESRDIRGIDCALLYRAGVMELVSAHAYPVVQKDALSPQCPDTLRTRDILYVCLRERSCGLLWHFLVNHHPSKYGGPSSSPKRIAAMQSMLNIADSLIAAGERNIVAMGDFNDTPLSDAFLLCEGHLTNLGVPLLEHSRNAGTIRYQGKWELIDNFVVSEYVAKLCSMSILRPAFLMERDKRHPGDKPRRTYIGPRYNAGLSDHLPIYLHLLR